MNIEWKESLKDWEASQGATPVTDPNEIKALSFALDWIGKNRFETIEYFEASLESKRAVEDDGLSKNEVLTEASAQIKEHEKIWRTHQNKEKLGLMTYEMPFVAQKSLVLRYLKVQFGKGKNCVYSAGKIEKTWIRYHQANKKIEVVHVK